MALPTRGQPDWDDELGNHLAGLEADLQSAKANAEQAISNANEARNVAQAVHGAFLGGGDAATATVLDRDGTASRGVLLATIDTAIDAATFPSPAPSVLLDDDGAPYFSTAAAYSTVGVLLDTDATPYIVRGV